jgi:HK97 family phage major capsid protein
METNEKFVKINALRELAEASLKNEDSDAANKYLDEMEALQDVAEKEAHAEERLVKAQTAERQPRNRVPVTSEDVSVDSINEKRADGRYRGHVDADYKPAGYNKALPAMSQASWVQDKMGSNLKQDAKFQAQTFAKWFTSSSQADFFQNASAEEAKAMQESTDAEGGFYVPDEYINENVLIRGTLGGQLQDSCTVINVNSKSGYMPTTASVVMAHVAEEAALTGAEQTPVVGQIAFNIDKYAGLTRVSDELLEDSIPNLGGVLSEIFSQAWGRLQDKMITGGSGTNAYSGIIGGSDYAGNSTQFFTMANATSIVAADITGAYFDVPAQYREADAFRWIFNSDIFSLITSIGVTAAGVHAIDSLTNAPDSFLMGRAVAINDNTGSGIGTSITSTEKCGVAGNMKSYYIFNRSGFSISRNDSLYQGNGQVGFFANVRSDGQYVRDGFRILRAA